MMAPLSSRPLSSPAASLLASTLTPPGSRSASPAPSTRTSLGGVNGSRNSGLFKGSLLDAPGALDNPTNPLHLMLSSFVPHIAVYNSADVDELVADKGFEGGLWPLLRPFGQRVPGRVVVRDNSSGGARTWDDFAVRFVRFGDSVEEPPDEPDLPRRTITPGANVSVGEPVSPGASGIENEKAPPHCNNDSRGGKKTRVADLDQVERVVDRHLSFAEDAAHNVMSPTIPTRQGLDMDVTSPYYALYLRRLLSGMPIAPHETFAHPVACIIAISSRNSTPIEALRKLYGETSQGPNRLPVWVDGEYLRYYVLVHDEEGSDISKSMVLFEQMKRHLGLHCHLLRMRSSQSAETDDDSIPLPRNDWMTAAEELAEMEKSEELGDFDDVAKHIFESDATAIRTFVREMVTQSIVPTMERNISVWNDQVASRRRGLSGRFMNLSRRWAPFGGGSRNSSSGGRDGSGSSNNNFDAQQGFYRPDTPEAIMRKLADFAFMLRDWKLAMSTYDLLRGCFQNDKAWRCHAAANEMCALSLLVMPQSMSSKAKPDTVRQVLEQAFYSYHTRCGSRYGVARCVILALEMLRLRGGPAIDEAVGWGTRLLELGVAGPVGEALLKERMAVCYASRQALLGSRRRKSALWSVLGTEAWVQQGKFVQAQRCLNEVRQMCAQLPSECGMQKLATASQYMTTLQAGVNKSLRSDGVEFGEDMANTEEPESLQD